MSDEREAWFRKITASYATLPSRATQDYGTAMTWAIDEIDRLRARVAELEAGEVQLGVQWTGPRWQGGEVETDPNFTVEGIRSYIADYEPDEHGVAVQRRVGPWLPLDVPAAPSVSFGEETS